MKGKPFFNLFTGLRTSITVAMAMAIWTALLPCATCTVDQSDGIYITYSTVARDLWRRKQTLSSGCALGLGSFTAINP